MNEDQMKGAWKEFTGKIKSSYADLTDDEVGFFNGKKDEFFGAIQKKYGDTREVAEKKVAEYETSTGYQYQERKDDSAA